MCLRPQRHHLIIFSGGAGAGLRSDQEKKNKKQTIINKFAGSVLSPPGRICFVHHATKCPRGVREEIYRLFFFFFFFGVCPTMGQVTDTPSWYKLSSSAPPSSNTVLSL